MTTIVEPKQYIKKLWGKQRIKEDQSFRLMKYVLRVDHEGEVLLHNVVTGQMVALDQDEAEAVNKLPTAYYPVIEQLISDHYLVPERYDEHFQIVNLRKILWKVDEARRKNGIVYYTILPTTACNARCWYCFEQGVRTTTMSEETANELIDFISVHSQGKPITIRWFGGEPTIAARRIDQICEGLHSRNVAFSSILSTNGYLLDEKMINKADMLWNLKRVTITVDGTEETTNRIKAFENVKESPYQIILSNIGCLLDHSIYVSLRMNIDQDNYQDFKNLVAEILERFQRNPLLQVYVHQIIDYNKQEIDEENEAWFQEKIFELNEFSRANGLYRKRHPLPCLFFQMCEAANDDAVTITPEGNIVCCGEQLGDDQIKGDLKHGVINESLVESWKQFGDYERCRDCILFPDCPSMMNCNGNGRCYRKLERMNQYTKEICRLFNDYLINQGGRKNEVSGT